MTDTAPTPTTSREELNDKFQQWNPFAEENARLNVEELEPYQYLPLANPGSDIRLLRLFPGRFDEPIRISIFHTTLDDELKPPRQSKRLSLADMQSKVPEGWYVWETIEKRFIFAKKDSNGITRNQWECPIDGMDPALYTYDEDDIPCFEPRYEALSYTWGDSGDEGSLIVQEGPANNPSFKQLRLQGNLIAALPCLRDPTSPRTFWIDSICINQDDDQEKGRQVHRMSLIYRGACRVVAWLGPEDSSISSTMKLLAYLGQHLELLDDNFNCPTPSKVPNPWGFELPLSPEKFEEIDDFFENPWFRRLWVVQEVRLANIRALLQCGRESLPFTLFQRAVMYLDRDVQATYYLCLLSRGTALSRPLEHRTFYRVVSMLRGKRCIDPRDKIYGCLGLVPPRFADQIQPAYSLPIGDAYRDVVLAHIRHTGRLEQMEYAHQYGRMIDAPSWVPDFSVGHFRETSCGYNQQASGLSRCDPVYKDPGFLQVQGKQCATVSVVSERFRRNYGSQGIAMMKTWSDMNDEARPHPTGVDPADVFGITLQHGSLKERRRNQKKHFLDLEEWRELLHEMMECPPGTKPQSIATDRIERKYIRESFSYCAGWSYIRTRENYVGMGPPDAQEGDLLCVLLGCASPVLLRETSPGGPFKVIGTCFIYGLEDAIGLLGPFPEPWIGNIEERPGLRRRLVYYNTETGEYSNDDPRLGDLGNWERVDHTTSHDDPEVFEYFKNKKTGEVTNSDPRMLPDALRERGVDLRTFVLA